MHNQKGVTLIELMVTIAIIAIITSIAIPAYNGYIESAQRSECGKEVGAIELALNENFLENNIYFLGGDVATIQNNSNGFYVSSYFVPGDPVATATNIAAANCTYVVAAGATGAIATSYLITATGANKLAGKGCILQTPVVCP